MKNNIVAIMHLAHWDQILGGTELQLKYLSEYLLSKGYVVHFIYLNRTSINEQDKSIHSHPITHYKIPSLGGKYWFIYKGQIVKKLESIMPDIIITRMFSSWQGIAAEFAAKNGLRHIHYVSSDKDVWRLEKRLSFVHPFDLIEKQFALKVFKYGSEVICLNDYQTDTLSRRYPIKVKKTTQAAPVPVNTMKNKHGTKIRVLWIANLKPLKRPEKYLEIVKAFSNNKYIEFVMIGSDADDSYTHLMKESGEYSNFFYRGKLTNDEVNRELENAHILINTSDYEGFSNTFVQAWMRGVVVLSLNSNPDNILTGKKIGYLTHTVKNTTEKITWLLNHRNELEQLSERSISYSLKTHAIDKAYIDDFS